MRNSSLAAAFLTALAAIASLAHETEATSYRVEEISEVKSPNGEFVLVVNRGTEKHEVFADGDRKSALWSFSHRLQFEELALADDGQSVGVIMWSNVRDYEDDPKGGDMLKPGVEILGPHGTLKSYVVKELCPNPRKPESGKIGPVGSFWRIWLNDTKVRGTEIEIKTTCGSGYVFSLKTGEMSSSRPQP